MLVKLRDRDLCEALIRISFLQLLVLLYVAFRVFMTISASDFMFLCYKKSS